METNQTTQQFNLTHILEELNKELNQINTPYKVASLLNKVGVKIKPQMIYNYCKKGFIPNMKDGQLNKIIIQKDDVLVWVEKYINKKNGVVLEDSNPTT